MTIKRFRWPLSNTLRLAIALSVVIPLVPAHAQNAEKPKAVLVMVPGLRAADFTSPFAPTLQRLVREGGSGWMVCRVAQVVSGAHEDDTPEAQALTLGCGARAATPSSKLFQVRVPGKVSACLGRYAVRQIRNWNAQLDHPVSIGALGTMIHEAGGTSVVISDVPPEDSQPEALLLAMDRRGCVDCPPNYLRCFRRDAGSPYGIRSDPENMTRLAQQENIRANLVVLDFHDVARAERYAPLCVPEIGAANRERALQSLDTLVARLLPMVVSAKARLILLTPGSASPADRQDRLAPLLLWGNGISPGRLTSASTRRAGIVVNTDFVPSLAEYLGYPVPTGLVGRPMTVLADKGLPSPQAYVAANRRLVNGARQQNALGGLPILQMCLVLIGLVAIAIRRFPLVVALTALTMITLPLGMIWLPPIVPAGVLAAGLCLVLFTAVPLLAGFRWRNSPRRLMGLYYGLTGALLTTILIDLLLGAPLLSRAWINASVMEAARFYGIGNEVMGLVIGSACVLFSGRAYWPTAIPKPDQEESGREDAPSSGDRAGQSRAFVLIAACCYGIIVLMLAAPRLGAKVGAIPSAGLAFGVLLLVLWERKLRLRTLLLVVGVAAIALAGFLAFDLRHVGAEQTHLARAFRGAGGDSLIGIARRKVLLEGGLLLHSAWSALLVTAGLSLQWLRQRRPELYRTANAALPPVTEAAWTGLILGSIASLVCNDSGLTAAALILLFAWSWSALRASFPMNSGTEPCPVENLQET